MDEHITRKRKLKSVDSDEKLSKSKKIKMGGLISKSGRSTKNAARPLHPESLAHQSNIIFTSKTLGAVSSSRNLVIPLEAAATKSSSTDSAGLWDEAELLARVSRVHRPIADAFVKLLSEGNTLPFIARYRKAMVGNLSAEMLQDLFEHYQNVSELKKKAKSALENLKKNKKLTEDVKESIIAARSLPELELVYNPLKTQTLTLAQKARNLGLQAPADQVLAGQYVDLAQLCDHNNEELASPDKVETHIIHIIADIIYKDPRVLEHMMTLKEQTNFSIESALSKSSAVKNIDQNKKLESRSDPNTYKLYFKFRCAVQHVKAHQVLAMNRGESEKFLSVKIVVPDWFFHQVERFCLTLWPGSEIVKKALLDGYSRLIKPWLSRQVRSQLTTAAQKESIKTFCNNLERYLLTEPIKNRRIAGLDPGFRAGCKVGIIDCNGQMLHTCTIHPDFRANATFDKAVKQLEDAFTLHQVELIGLGNGTACRETESWLNKHKMTFRALAVPVVIVPEQGASIYSISKEAIREHPNMDPNHISALSIARRVLDPLGELIKLEPKHLGVGMYQHDIPEKMLDAALTATLERIVSLVGVDLNTASHALLKRIAGLKENQVKNIVEYRREHGGFSSRAQLLKVTGVGKVTYEQCAGFLRVLGGSEPLDSTIIHPESYKVAKKFAQKLELNLNHLNEPQFPERASRALAAVNLVAASTQLATDPNSLDIIVSAFKRVSHEAISFGKPIYSECQNVGQLRAGMTITGVVRNVVDFGCFVDCGVGDNGLIHRTKLNGNRTPKLGERVRVTLISDPKPKKIDLKLIQIFD